MCQQDVKNGFLAQPANHRVILKHRWIRLKSLSDLPDPARIILEFAQIRPLNRH
jgi:hypothetical protein